MNEGDFSDDSSSRIGLEHDEATAQEHGQTWVVLECQGASLDHRHNNRDQQCTLTEHKQSDQRLDAAPPDEHEEGYAQDRSVEGAADFILGLGADRGQDFLEES